MGKWIHRLTNIDKIKRRAHCQNCGEIRIVLTGGVWRCNISRKRYINGGFSDRYKYRNIFFKSKLRKCFQCGIYNEDIRFFDVNHIDSNHKNNNPSNLELVCPNCHRLKTIKLWNELIKYNN